MLDDVVGGTAPVGGVQRRWLRGPQLVDDSDEGTRSHRGPNGEDSDANDSSIRLGDDDRRGGDEQEVAQVVGRVLALVRRFGLATRQQADGGVEIGESGAADVNLHESLSGAKRSERAAGRPT